MDINNSGKYIFLGGTRSGKSLIAEQVISLGRDAVCYLATAPRKWTESDSEFKVRVAEHQLRRGASWQTVELSAPGDLYGFISNAKIPTVIDSIGSWIASEVNFRPDPLRLIEAIEDCRAPLSFVAEEAGMSIHPAQEVARAYIDALGEINQAIASIVDRAFLVVAGRITELFVPHFVGDENER